MAREPERKMLAAAQHVNRLIPIGRATVAAKPAWRHQGEPDDRQAGSMTARFAGQAIDDQEDITERVHHRVGA